MKTLQNFTPREVVSELDRYIIGQNDAKRAVAIALRKAIEAGEMEATVRQDPARMGREGVELAVKVIQGEEVPQLTPIDGLLITADNVAEFLVEEEPAEEEDLSGEKEPHPELGRLALLIGRFEVVGQVRIVAVVVVLRAHQCAPPSARMIDCGSLRTQAWVAGS